MAGAVIGGGVPALTLSLLSNVAIAQEADFDLDELIAAAQAEGELTVYDTSSRITPVAELFEETYGIRVNATKLSNPEQVERVRREVDAGNIQVDVVGLSDGPTIVNELIPQGYVTNWVPPDLADLIPEQFHYPLTYRLEQRIFGYNTDSYESSPITNIWELTEPEWQGRVMLRDPATTPANIGFFAVLTEHHDLLAEAYEQHYGEEIQLSEANAGWEFLARFFQNDPIVMGSDGDVGDAVGAAGQTDAPIGFYVYTKHRDIVDKDLRLAVAFDVEPFIGYASGTHVVLVNNSPNPNAAKLFARFLMTEEGVSQWTVNDLGGYSPNPQVGVHADDELGSWEAWQPFLVQLDDELTWAIGQDVLDMWFTYAAK
ncbi:MAG: ABC transporter substrate-binding protein [Cyanophyceae cyanobacterium]